MPLDPTETSAKIDWRHIKNNGKQNFIIDSGASFHLTAYENLSTSERKRVTEVKNPLSLSTANGHVRAKHHVRMYVEIIEQEVE